MKKITIVLLLPLFILMISCSSTEEVSTDDNRPSMVQMHQFQEQQDNQEERRKEAGERSGLTPDVTQKLADYAERKADLACQIQNLDKSAAEAFSDAAQAEVKEMLISLETQMTPLNREIEQYCDTESKTKYFNQIYRRYIADCQP